MASANCVVATTINQFNSSFATKPSVIAATHPQPPAEEFHQHVCTSTGTLMKKVCFSQGNAEV